MKIKTGLYLQELSGQTFIVDLYSGMFLALLYSDFLDAEATVHADIIEYEFLEMINNGTVTFIGEE